MDTTFYERDRTGVGRKVEVNLLDTCMALLDKMYEFENGFSRIMNNKALDALIEEDFRE